MLRFHHFSRWTCKPTSFVLQTNHLAPIQAHPRRLVLLSVIAHKATSFMFSRQSALSE